MTTPPNRAHPFARIISSTEARGAEDLLQLAYSSPAPPSRQGAGLGSSQTQGVPRGAPSQWSAPNRVSRPSVLALPTRIAPQPIPAYSGQAEGSASSAPEEPPVLFPERTSRPLSTPPQFAPDEQTDFQRASQGLQPPRSLNPPQGTARRMEDYFGEEGDDDAEPDAFSEAELFLPYRGRYIRLRILVFPMEDEEDEN